MHHKDYMKSMCQQYLHQPVMAQTLDNQTIQGYIEYVDDENVYLMVPEDTQDYRSADERQFFGPGYGPGFGAGYGGFYGPRPGFGFGGFPGYGYGPYPYPYPRPRPGGFRRLALPLAALGTLAVLPFVL
ncbi:hypothetical protein [Bacillus sp. FJAT-45350]|uniref:hypothetical protein n=1 Tax=Bacillus sp. FJAT-45350 TaxID=2011014 RepID=UPI000BB90E65|nr:hypothetical protein [Bacillus sp. FJAT-45350]